MIKRKEKKLKKIWVKIEKKGLSHKEINNKRGQQMLEERKQWIRWLGALEKEMKKRKSNSNNKSKNKNKTKMEHKQNSKSQDQLLQLLIIKF